VTITNIDYQKQVRELFSKVNREGFDKLQYYLIRNGYLTAKGSTKYHSNFKGGLLEHSLLVYKLFKEMCIRYNIDLSEESIIIVSLLHDAYKVLIHKDKYKKYNGHGLLSLQMIEKFIVLTKIEREIIRFHMGIYSSWEYDKTLGEFPIIQYVNITNEYPVIKLFNMADDISATFLERRV